MKYKVTIIYVNAPNNRALKNMEEKKPNIIKKRNRQIHKERV